VSSFIEEYRSNQDDLKSLRREHEQCRKDRDRAVANRKECEKECNRLSDNYGCSNLAELRDKISELRHLQQEIDKLSERLAGVLGLENNADREKMMRSAREILGELHDRKERIEGDQMNLAHRETDFLQRTSCDDLLQLAERTKKLRSMLARKGQLTAAIDAYTGGKSLEDLKNEQNALTLEIKVAVSRLEEDFAGFEASVEQTEFWRKEKQRLESEIPRNVDDLTRARTELKLLEEHATTSPAELEGEKKYIENEIEHGDFIVTACNVAVDVLKQVEAEHHDTYVPKLEAEAGERFARLTGNSYSAINLVEKWPKELMAVDHAGRQIDANKLSRGTIDQLYFSLRVALGKALSGVTTLPLMLDDPFVNFDSGRFEKAMKTVASLVEEGRQIFYFTHDSQVARRKQQWQDQGIDIHCTELGT
jgi:DNA repair exonuclease SbcCD ATPase subunit